MMNVIVAIGNINQMRMTAKYAKKIMRKMEVAIGMYRRRITIPKRKPMAV